jgi:hypothetical protein
MPNPWVIGPSSLVIGHPAEGQSGFAGRSWQENFAWFLQESAFEEGAELHGV